jgi:transcription antitermination factor NusG
MTEVRSLRSLRAGWYAIRTRSRHEKRVREELDRRGMVSFLPTVMRWSRWKDRTKRIEEPLFGGYCFVQLAEGHDALPVLRIVGAVELVGGPHGPEPVDDVEIDGIRRLVASWLPYDPHPFLTTGTEVRVVRGPLRGVRGILLRKDRATRLVISVSLIRQAAIVEIHPADVAPFEPGGVPRTTRPR